MKKYRLTISFIIFLLISCFYSGAQQLPLRIAKPEYKNNQFIFRNNISLQDTAVKKSGYAQLRNYNRANSANGKNTSYKVTQPNSPIILYITTTNPTCGYSEGTIVVQATNGTPPYTYTLTDQYNGVQTQLTGNFPLQNASSSPFTVTVTDALGNSTSTIVTLKDINPGPVLQISPAIVYPSTCTSSDASFSVNATGGTPPYTYSWDLINFSPVNTFTNLNNGYYSVYVKDANGCLYSTVMLFPWNNPNCLTAFGLSYTPYVCGTNGSINAKHYGGEGPYTYSIDGVNYTSNGDFTNLGVGTYKVYAKNAAGVLVNIYSVNLLQNCFIDIDYIAVDAACKQNDGVMTVNAINGTPPYTYTIDGINYQNSNVFTGLAPGNYAITVKDANGITSSLPAAVYDRCPVVRAVASGESCTKNDGTITAGGFKGTSPYEFSIDGVNFQTSNIFSGLAKGNYTITIKDANGFISATTVMVEDACLPFTANTTNATCGNSNGSISVTVTAGTAPYQYSLDGVNFQSGNIFNGLPAKNYNVTVKDAGGKSNSKTVAVVNIDGPQINTVITPASCKNNDGAVTVTNTGGSSPFQYSKDGINFQASSLFSNLTGLTNITFTIKDANGCIDTKNITVPVNCPAVSAVVKDETCSSSNGTITVAGVSGTPPYQYAIDGINFQGSTLFANLKAGNYTITIKDALGYTNTASVVIKNSCPTVSATGTNGLCGTANAIITATGANGITPYEYSIDGVNFQANNVFTGLANGTYTITVRDAAGLKNTTTVVVTNFPPPQFTATSTNAGCLNNDGTITVKANGGTSPLQYSINDISYQSNSNFNGIGKGVYTVFIKDANVCKVSGSVMVDLTDNLTLATKGDKTICEGNNVVVEAISNGSSFNWLPVTGLNNAAVINPIAYPVTTTKYYVNATLGICSKKDSVVVFVNPAPRADAGADITVCYGQNTRLTGNGGVSYKWSPVNYLDNTTKQSPVVIKPQNTITYTLEVADAKGCKSLNTETITITVTPPAEVFAGNDTSIAINEPLPLIARDINNSGFNQYIWSPSYGLNKADIQNPVAILDREIKYTVKAVTPQGCEGSDDIVIKVFKAPEIFVPTAFTPNRDNKNDLLKAIPVGIKTFKYFTVYNRWGQPVFTTADVSVGWDGKMSGTDNKTELFTWVAEGLDYKGNKIFRKGTVLLIR